jgi:hypothetical protein
MPIRVPGHPVPCPVVPQLGQSELQQRQSGRFTKQVLDESINYALLELQTDSLCRLFDGLSKFAR